MKSAKWILPVMLLMVTSLAMGQTVSTTIVAKVPFEFVIGNQVMPAGDWVVQAQSGDILALRNYDARKSVLAASMRDDEKPENRTVLVFERYGDQYFLSQIKVENTNLTYKLPKGRAEKELRAQNVPVSAVTLLAALQ